MFLFSTMFLLPRMLTVCEKRQTRHLAEGVSKITQLYHVVEPTLEFIAAKPVMPGILHSPVTHGL